MAELAVRAPKAVARAALGLARGGPPVTAPRPHMDIHAVATETPAPGSAPDTPSVETAERALAAPAPVLDTSASVPDAPDPDPPAPARAAPASAAIASTSSPAPAPKPAGRNAWTCTSCGAAYRVVGEGRHRVFWPEGSSAADAVLDGRCGSCGQPLPGKRGA